MNIGAEHQPVDAYLWEVMASFPDGTMGGSHNSYSNLRLFVVTSSAERAMELVRERFPTCRFHKVERRNQFGKQGVIVDTEVVK